MNTLSKYASTLFLPHILLLALLILESTEGFAQQFNYAPNAIHFCQLQRKYAATLTGGLGRGNSFASKEWQATFSPIEHGAIMINYFGAQKKAVLHQLEEGGSSRFAEIGIGAYEATALGVASLFVGFGQGSIFNNYSLNHLASFDLQRWFIQPTIVRHTKNFEWGVALRFTRLAYSHGRVDYSISDSDLRSVQAIEAKSPFFIPEFGFHAGLNFSPVTFSMNMTSLFYTANAFNFERINSAFMLSLDLSSFYQKKKAVSTPK